jgi:hypothetical protein
MRASQVSSSTDLAGFAVGGFAAGFGRAFDYDAAVQFNFQCVWIGHIDIDRDQVGWTIELLNRC